MTCSSAQPSPPACSAPPACSIYVRCKSDLQAALYSRVMEAFFNKERLIKDP